MAKGMLWGLIPCGLLYGALMAAVATQVLINGGLFMYALSLVTLPSIFVASGLMHKIQHTLTCQKLKNRSWSWLMAFGA